MVSSQNAPATACSYMARGVCPRRTATAASSVSDVCMSTGSSLPMEHLTPAASMAGSGCPSSERTTPVRRLLTGVTSQTMPRSASSASSAGSSTARTPCRRRSACRSSSAERMEAGAGRLAGVRRRLEPALPRDGERPRERGGREPVFAAAQADAGHAALAVPDGPLRELLADLGREVARDVRREADLHAVGLTGLVGAVAVALEHLLPRRAAQHRLRGREQRLGVEAALSRQLAGVVDDDLAEVAAGRSTPRRLDPDPMKRSNPREAAEPLQPRDGARRQLHVVAAARARADARALRSPRGARGARSWATVRRPSAHAIAG